MEILSGRTLVAKARLENLITRPVLKYNGGKFLLAPWIISHFPPHTSFVDLFGGGGNILLRKQRSTFEYYNDIDKRVVNFFDQLNEHKLELIRRIKYTPYSRIVFERTKRANQSSGIEGALNFYINCWMSMVQNKSGGTFRARGNIGYEDGRYNPAGMWSDISPLFAAAERFRGVHIECLDYRKIVAKLDHSQTLIYADPPYLGLTRYCQAMYEKEITTPLDHARIALNLRNLKSMVIISGYDSRLYKRLYEEYGWLKVSKETRDNKRNLRTECLWINPVAQENFSQRELFS